MRSKLSDYFLSDYFSATGDKFIRNIEEGWMPTHISGCVMWLAADSITGLNDGEAVTNWYENSGINNHAVQSNVSNKPVYKTNIINGKPIVRFNGASAYMIAPDLILSSASVFLVSKQKAIKSVGNNTVISTRPGANYIEMGYSNQGEAGGNAYAGLNNGGFILNYHNVGGSTSFQVVSAIYKGSTPSSILCGVNGVMDSTINVGSLPSSYTISGTSVTTIGQLGGIIANYYFDGDVAEILVYSNALDDINRQIVEQYLATKYNLY